MDLVNVHFKLHPFPDRCSLRRLLCFCFHSPHHSCQQTATEKKRDTKKQLCKERTIFKTEQSQNSPRSAPTSLHSACTISWYLLHTFCLLCDTNDCFTYISLFPACDLNSYVYPDSYCTGNSRCGLCAEYYAGLSSNSFLFLLEISSGLFLTVLCPQYFISNLKLSS